MKKHFIIILLFGLFVLFLGGCAKPVVTGPSLIELKAELTLEETLNLKVDFLLPRYIGNPDEDGNYNHTVTWTSSKTNVISIGGLNEAGTAYLAHVSGGKTSEDLILTALIALNNSTDTTPKTFNVSVAAATNFISTLQAKMAKDATVVEIAGVISYVNEKGFFVEDTSGTIYVYLDKAHTYKVGDQVVVSGTKSTYSYSQNHMPQITNSPAATITVESNTPYSKEPTETTYDDIKAKLYTDASFYGETITLSGIVEASSDYNTPFIIREVGSSNYIGINSYTIAAAKTELGAHLGENLTLTLLVYDYFKPEHGDKYWRFLYIENTLKDAPLPALSDSEKVSLSKESLINEFDGKIINTSLTLPVTNLFGVTISWVSDNPAIANTGEYTAPENDIVVHLVATITSGEVSDTVTLNITAKKSYVAGDLHVVINEVYGGGGNSGATYTHDFIELYNPTEADISLAGWSIQYASKTGTFNQIIELSGTIKAHSYYLIQCAKGAGGTKALPTPDLTCEIAMAAASCKVALAINTDMVTSPTAVNVVDYVGVGNEASAWEGSSYAPTLDNSTSASRTNFVDTDNNAADFKKTQPSPQNSSSQ